jgi:hypothetical protein
MKKEMIIAVCETGVVVVLDRSLMSASMESGLLKPIHAFNSLDRAIAFIRKTIKESRATP